MGLGCLCFSYSGIRFLCTFIQASEVEQLSDTLLGFDWEYLQEHFREHLGDQPQGTISGQGTEIMMETWLLLGNRSSWQNINQTPTRHGNENTLSHPIRAEVLTLSGQENKENQFKYQRLPSCFSLCGSQTCLQTLGSWGGPVLCVMGLSTAGSGFHIHSLRLAPSFDHPKTVPSLKTLILPSLRLQLSLSLSCCWLGSCSHDS